MSEQIAAEGEWAGRTNMGVTLPDGGDATYNASLSPFFIVRDTTNYILDKVIRERGNEGYLYSSTSSNLHELMSHYFGIDTVGIYPSIQDSRIYGLSLRCLVSTN